MRHFVTLLEIHVHLIRVNPGHSCLHKKRKAGFFQFLRFEDSLESFLKSFSLFCDGLVWTIGLTRKIKYKIFSVDS